MPGKGTRVPENLSETYPVTNHPSENPGGSEMHPDGARNGLFTANLRAVWDGGRFTGSYRRFRDRIASRMPASQTPNYFVAGSPSASFAAQTPFSV